MNGIQEARGSNPLCSIKDLGNGEFELLPVKRTVKNHKILATSNVIVAGRFFPADTAFTESAIKQKR